jgi:hypothetical protein
LVREQFKRGPRPQLSVRAVAEAAEIPERSPIAAANVLGAEGRRIVSRSGDFGPAPWLAMTNQCDPIPPGVFNIVRAATAP